MDNHRKRHDTYTSYAICEKQKAKEPDLTLKAWPLSWLPYMATFRTIMVRASGLPVLDGLYKSLLYNVLSTIKWRNVQQVPDWCLNSHTLNVRCKQFVT